MEQKKPKPPKKKFKTLSQLLSHKHHKICEKCTYFDRTVHCCDYYLLTGERRGCTPTNKHCDKFEKGARDKNTTLNEGTGWMYDIEY